MAKGTTTKRKAVAYDGALERVAQALGNLGCGAAPIATGASDRFPQPGLALRDGAELRFPVGASDAQAIKARGLVYHQHKRADAAWLVPGDALELRNGSLRWDAFLKECVDKARVALGITPAAQIQVALREMLLVETGATLQGPQGEQRGEGAFGTLLMVLPGEFKGGSFAVPAPPSAKSKATTKTKANDKENANANVVPTEGTADKAKEGAKEKTVQWRPAARKSPYDLSYVAFYNHCAVDAKPVTSGSALCLVYEIKTTTPREVPMFHGPSQLQGGVNQALSEYFAPAPAALDKRLKVGEDAWRMINEFTSDRKFAYVVEGKSFETLSGHEVTVAESLAAFCAQSQGQYVLYHSGVLLSREPVKFKQRSFFDFSPLADDGGELHIALKKPWRKHGTSVAFEFPHVRVSEIRDVAPLGNARKIKLHLDAYDLSQDDSDIFCEKHFDYKQVGVASAHALVVLPAAIERTQAVKMDLEHVTAKLREMLLSSRDEARQFARSVIAHRSPWSVYDYQLQHFYDFLAVVQEINDVSLFHELLLSIRMHFPDRDGKVRAAVNHFGYDACVDVVVRNVLSARHVTERVHLINAVLDASSASVDRINQLLDPLLSHHPWTDVKIDPSVKKDYMSDANAFAGLLALAAAVSPEKLLQAASVRSPHALIQTVVPALEPFAKTYGQAALQPVVQHVSRLFVNAKAAVCNEPFAEAKLPEHCINCARLREFLQSPDVEASVSYTGNAQSIKHMQTVLDRAFGGIYEKSVAVYGLGANLVRLTKKNENGSHLLWRETEHAEKTLRALTLPTNSGAGSGACGGQ